MDNALIEIIKLISSIATPIIVLIFGIIITRKIEYIKNEASKKKEWQTKWSENFFQIFQEFNLIVENLLCLLYRISELTKSGKTCTPEIEQMHKLLEEIQRKEFSIETQLCFTSQGDKEIVNLLHKMREQINECFHSKTGSLIDIHNTLKRLNINAKIVHGEILNLE